MSVLDDLKNKFLRNKLDENGKIIITNDMSEDEKEIFELYNNSNVNIAELNEESNLNDDEEDYIEENLDDDIEENLNDNLDEMLNEEETTQSVDDMFTDL